MKPLELIELTHLMEITSGRSEIIIALIDGPVAVDHPDLINNIREISGIWRGGCTMANSTACMHGTFVAGILSAKRGSVAPAICPDCTLFVRPIFVETIGQGQIPSANPEELAAAIIEMIDVGARVINLSAALTHASAKEERELEQALDRAAMRSVIVIAAAGNQGEIGSTVITRHPWVIPVAACDQRGYPLHYSNLGNSIGRRGLSSPGDSIASLGTDGNALTLNGTSAAAPFVTGATALLWSVFPDATALEIKSVIMLANTRRRASVVPPLLDAWSAYQALRRTRAPNS